MVRIASVCIIASHLNSNPWSIIIVSRCLRIIEFYIIQYALVVISGNTFNSLNNKYLLIPWAIHTPNFLSYWLFMSLIYGTTLDVTKDKKFKKRKEVRKWQRQLSVCADRNTWHMTKVLTQRHGITTSTGAQPVSPIRTSTAESHIRTMSAAVSLVHSKVVADSHQRLGKR